MAAKSGLLAILVIIAIFVTPSLVSARDPETTKKAIVDRVPMLRAVLGEAIGDACNWCLPRVTYCCGELLHCCGQWCCRNPCVGNACG